MPFYHGTHIKEVHDVIMNSILENEFVPQIEQGIYR